MLVTRLMGRALAAKARRIHILDRVLQIAVRPGALAQRRLAITMAVAASTAASSTAAAAAFAIGMRMLANGRSLARPIFLGRTGIVILMRDRVLGRGLVRELGGLRTLLPLVMIAPAAPSPTPPATA